ncbi:uncharacterized protein LOC131947164 [Physella acuta]|uniref:uncharacterized protein LOC131947164 n=1 Tax=Physella acuta TaxID=109671 RepID=UPI0027DD4F55|nr:uncharacterized protein LOC131947164 [Physella acuta]
MHKATGNQIVHQGQQGKKMLGRIVARRFSSLAEPLKKVGPGNYAIPNTSAYKKFMERQALFLQDDGHLVWQKLPKDKPLFGTAAALVGVATAWTVYSLYVFASPPKNN